MTQNILRKAKTVFSQAQFSQNETAYTPLHSGVQSNLNRDDNTADKTPPNIPTYVIAEGRTSRPEQLLGNLQSVQKNGAALWKQRGQHKQK